MIKRIYEMSIWAHDAIPAEEWKFRNLKRIMFPMVDFLFIISGLSAAYFGVPAISEFFPRYIVDTFSTLLSVSGFIAFLGVSFPKLWGFEMAAKSILLGLMAVYFTSLLLLISAGESNRVFVLGVTAIAMCPIVWRLSLLGTEWQNRRIHDKKVSTGEVTIHGG